MALQIVRRSRVPEAKEGGSGGESGFRWKHSQALQASSQVGTLGELLGSCQSSGRSSRLGHGLRHNKWRVTGVLFWQVMSSARLYAWVFPHVAFFGLFPFEIFVDHGDSSWNPKDPNLRKLVPLDRPRGENNSTTCSRRSRNLQKSGGQHPTMGVIMILSSCL